MHISSKTIPLILAILLSACSLVFMTTDECYVAAPGFICVVVAAWVLKVLWVRDGKPPFFDIGLLCIMATLIYTVYPLVNYWSDGLKFGVLSDYRLQQYHIQPAELGFFYLRYVIYFLSLAAAYLAFRVKTIVPTGNVRPPSRSEVHTIFIFFSLLTAYFILLKLATGASYNFNYHSDVSQRVTFSSLPLLLAQVSGKLVGILLLFKVALLCIVIGKCKQLKWLTILFLWAAVEISATVLMKGARTQSVLFVLSAALLYHRLIKPFSMKLLVLTGAIFIMGFVFMGLLRGYGNMAELQEDQAFSEVGLFGAGNEFQALLGTSYDVLKLKEAGSDLPGYLYINDFISILPPQQLLPFKKITASDWYLQEIGIYGSGQGFMWGVITQSIVGLDWIELIFRGILLGYILALLHRWYCRHQSEFMATILYTFLCVKIYYTFRDTTFSLLSSLVWEVIPFYIILRIGGSFPGNQRSSENLGSNMPTLNRI